MKQADVLETDKNFEELIRLLDKVEEDEIQAIYDGIAKAKMVSFEEPENRRIGIAKGLFPPLDLEEFNSLNEEIAKEFYGE